MTEASEPLDTPQEFEPATSHRVRDELQDYLERDLLGPWDGPTEEFAPRAPRPRDRYLVGMLGPKYVPNAGSQRHADDAADLETATGGDTSDPDLPEMMPTQQLGRIWASSMGLAFAVKDTVRAIVVTASWGHYARRQITIEDGATRTVWYREPIEHTAEIRLDEAERSTHVISGAEDDGVRLHVTSSADRHRPDIRVVEITLINAQAEPDRGRDGAWLFQTQLAVTALDGAEAIFEPIGDPLDSPELGAHDDEERHLQLLYRDHRRYAAGRNVAVHAESQAGQRNAHRLVTTWLPNYEVPPTAAAASGLDGLTLGMDTLAGATPEQLAAGLAPLVSGYRAWLDQRAAAVDELPEHLRGTAESAIDTARAAHDRIAEGIALLTDPARPRHDEAYAAFRFANRAMALQRWHTEIGRLREDGRTYAEAEAEVLAEGERNASWRPFQLAFVLLNLPAITEPTHPERAANPESIVDLLFFPTGGGKTEAYLGLTAYTFAIRRLQGVIGSRQEAHDGSDGVAVLMRYTLRLLTAQQFQRAAALVCAAETLRRADPDTWGQQPFRIGLWVGGGVSPNWYPEAAEQVAAARAAPDGKRPNVLQTLTCPWCGERLLGHRDLYPDEDRRRILLYCGNGEGASACPFSRRNSPGEGLPILTVDEEIYRLTPSLVIATVDKFAQLPWRGYAGHLFGRVTQHCGRHGYRHPDLDARVHCGSRHNAKPDLPAASSEPVRRLRPPDLIIQDELHLISGALGTTVGLFEAAVDELCGWDVDGHRAAPKIVASTATTKRAAEQVRGIFGRQLAIFPPQVTDVTDTFFSRQAETVDESSPGRRYLGVCAHGVRMKQVEIRVAEILLLAGQTLFDRYGSPADPYMSLVGYFNATRELAGMRRLVEDDVAIRLRRKRSGLSWRLVTKAAMPVVQELTSRISSADISEVLKRLEIGFDEDMDTSDRRGDIPKAAATAQKQKTPMPSLAEKWSEREQSGQVPIDVVLATSMLQVGVDVSRFGLMVVAGQPKNTAEYIQASSRVGRNARKPGLVVTLYNWTRPRDLAHFEDFEHYHATFYRQVESLSVTPYTRRSLDRSTAGTVIGAIRNVADSFSANRAAQDVELSSDTVAGVRARMLARAEAIASGQGARYFDERIQILFDRWNQLKGGSFRVGYTGNQSGKEALTPLLERPGDAPWGTLTVAQSMRETEQDINLLVPRAEEMFAQQFEVPPWSFAPPSEQSAEDGASGDEDAEDEGAEL